MSNAFFPTRRELALCCCAFLSGASCLILELVWFRYLHLIFGVSVYAVATLLACFMLGLALGNWHLGEKLDGTSNPARFLKLILLGLGLYFLISPLIYQLIGSVGPHLPMQKFACVMLAMLALIVPTYLLGGALPAVTRLAIAQTGSPLGTIYGLNTLGAAIGAMVTGFFLIQSLGLRGTLLVGAACSFLAAGLVPKYRIEANPGVIKSPAEERSGFVHLTLIVLGISGFTSMAYEVYWTRLLTYFLRDSIYDLTIVLTVFLWGIMLGSSIGAFFVKRARAWLGAVQIAIGITSFLGLFLVARFPYWINDLQTNTAIAQRFGEHYWLEGTLVRVAVAMLLMSLPTCLMGAMIPLAGAVCIRDSRTFGKNFGLICGVNAVGAALGPILAGFVLIPLVGIQNSIILNVALNISAGLVLLVALDRDRILPAIAGAAVLAVIMALLIRPWDKLRMSTSFLDPSQRLEDLLKLDFYREDAFGITSVVEFKPLGSKYLITNRIYAQNTSEATCLDDHRRLGQIPMLLHPNAKSVLAVGLGAGVTLRGVSDLDPSRIDCVEISPAVVEASSRFFAAENGRILENPKVRLVVDDARHYMNAATARYDLIVLDILFPMSSGSSTVFSREYFQLCKNRLQPGGMVCQWLPIHQLSLEQIKTIVATFRSVFPHTSLWFGTIGDSGAAIGCIGTEQPLRIGVAQLRDRMNIPAISAELRPVNLQSPSLLLSHFIMAEEDVAKFCAGAALDTDDSPIIEFAAPKLAVQSSRQGILNLVELSRAMQGIGPLVTSVPDDLAKYVAAKKAVIDGLSRLLDGDEDTRMRIYRSAATKDPQNEDLQCLLNAQ